MLRRSDKTMRVWAAAIALMAVVAHAGLLTWHSVMQVSGHSARATHQISQSASIPDAVPAFARANICHAGVDLAGADPAGNDPRQIWRCFVCDGVIAAAIAASPPDLAAPVSYATAAEFVERTAVNRPGKTFNSRFARGPPALLSA